MLVFVLVGGVGLVLSVAEARQHQVDAAADLAFLYARDMPLEPLAEELRRSLLDYAAGDKFRPTASLTVAQVKNLWATGAAPGIEASKRAFDRDLDDGSGRQPAPKKS